MAFTIPQFPLTVNCWRAGNPTSNPPDLSFPGNLAFGRRVTTQFWNWDQSGDSSVNANLLCPAGTDIRDYASSTGEDTVEIPAGSGRFYLVTYVDDIGQGFSNMHRFAILNKVVPWPTPLP